MKKRWIILGVYLITVVVCAVIIYVIPPVAGLLEQTYICEYGNLEVSDEVDALIIRDDTVYLSKKAGEVNRLVDEGTLVRTGCKILELSGEGKDEVSGKYREAIDSLGDAAGKSMGGTQKAGYVTFQFDGYEGEFTPDRIKKITYEQFEEVSDKDIIKMPAKSVAKGEPISRITSNGAWWLLIFVDNSVSGRYNKGDIVNVVLDGETVEATIQSVKKGDDRTRVVIKSKMNCKGYLLTRKPTVKVITSSADGIILEKKSLVTIGDNLGVIVLDKVGNKYFRPVKVKADDGEKVAVYEDIYMDENSEFVETIDNYDEILKEPTDKDIEEIKASLKSEE